MREERMLNLLGQIDNEYILEAAPRKKAGRKKAWHKWMAVAACLCLIAVSAITMTDWRIPTGDGQTDEGAGGPMPEENSDGYNPIPGGQITENTQDPDAQTQQTEYVSSPVYYGSLMFSDAELNIEALSLPEEADILPFDESLLSQDGCCMIVEGTIVNLYVKQYDYDVHDDKFDKNDIMHMQASTVVYEIAVGKTWYGEDVSGGTITVEDAAYFAEPALAVKTGRRYVLPLYEYGDTIWTLGHEYVGGDITRESRFSTVYPQHPQIEVTDDGFYFVPQDWTTLTSKNAREVIMNNLDQEYAYYRDKMYLVDSDSFTSQISVLVSNIE